MSDIVKLPGITEEECPHCGASADTDTVGYSIKGQVLDVCRKFTCGFYIHCRDWSKHEENRRIAPKESCHKSEEYQQEIKEKADKIFKTIKAIDEMDVSEYTKEQFKKTLSPLPWEYREHTPF